MNAPAFCARLLLTVAVLDFSVAAVRAASQRDHPLGKRHEGVVMASADSSRSAESAEVMMSHVGKSFVFDYGETVIRVRYLSEARLEWEQIKGPEAGLKGEEAYGCAAVRDDVVFFWWQEKDASVVTQVVDFGRAFVHTTWTSPDRKLAAFQGKVRPSE